MVGLMSSIMRSTVGLGLLVGASLLLGCSGSAGVPAPSTAAEQEEGAIARAKEIDKGDKLKNGESREIMTSFGPVIVSKDQNGAVTYKKK